VLTREARGRRACLLLVLGSPPPVNVQGILGLLNPADVIRQTLPLVYERADPHPMALDELLEAVNDHLLWTTWSAIAEVIDRAEKGRDR
jgi:hypothetical protein